MSSSRRCFLGFRLQQRLPVGERDLVVVGMDFGEGQKAVAIAAVIDEGRLQRRLYARDFREIDIAADLFLVFAIRSRILLCGFRVRQRRASLQRETHR